MNQHLASCPTCGHRTAICEQCGRVYPWEAMNRGGRFCSRACYYKSKRGRLRVTELKGPRQQRLRRMPGHPLAPPGGMLAVARIVLYDKIGPGPHPCHWCGEPVDWVPGGHTVPGALLADHLDWNRSNDAPENLVPACNACNAHRRSDHKRSRLQPGEATVIRGGRPTRAVERICEVCGAIFLVPPAAIKPGKCRFCSRSCAGIGRMRDRQAAS